MAHLVPTPVTPDPITAILVAVTEMRALLGSVVDDVKNHSGDISRLRDRDEDKSVRLAALEVTVASLPRSTVSPAVVWVAIGVAAAAIAALAALLGLHLGG